MKKRKENKKQTIAVLTMISQIGLEMIVAVGMMTALGVWLDDKLGTSFITVICFFLGALGGGSGAYRMIKQTFGDGQEKDD